jgi:ATP-dependent DNA helicase RecG
MPATNPKPPAPTPAKKPAKPAASIESKLAKLGLRTDMDLVLHLPMRYEDETQIVPIREACLRGGHVSQVEGVVIKNEITYKPRRQLLVSIADETSDVQLRFMNFYGSQVKQLAEGTRGGAARLLRRRDGSSGL